MNGACEAVEARAILQRSRSDVVLPWRSFYLTWSQRLEVQVVEQVEHHMTVETDGLLFAYGRSVLQNELGHFLERATQKV